MNLLIFSLFLLIGFYASHMNMKGKKTSTFIKLLFVLSFILCGISRVGHSKDYSDLTYYVDYFENDVTTYFEPGYLFFTEIIKVLFGSNGTYLVFCVGVLVASIICYCCYILESKYEKAKMQNTLTKSKGEMFFIFSFMFFVYWGLAFEAERIRIGIATTFLVLSTAMCFCKYRYTPYIYSIAAIFFQYTTIIYLPIVWLLQRDFVLPNKRVYIIWLILLLIIDFLVINFNIFNSLFIFHYLEMLDIDQVGHYMEYESEGKGIYSLQYLWYHITPFLLFGGDFRDKDFNKGVLLYFIGLTLSTMLQTIPAGHRVADMFEIMIIFPLLFEFVSNSISMAKYKFVFSFYILMQAIMCARYLSIHL